MTGRERLMALLHRQPVDRLSWTTLIDEATLNIVPENLQGISPMDFYRHIGCDIFLLNGWATPHNFASPKLVWPEGVTERWRKEGEESVQEWVTPKGTLTAVFRQSHPIKYPVETADDLRIYREMWEGARYIYQDDAPVLAAVNALIGDDGITTRYWGSSTIQRLLQFDMGMEFYYLLADQTEEMEALFDLMHQRELDAFKILAQGPCETVILCENTSTLVIGPEIYREYNMPHVRDFVDITKAAGKVALVHMCGHVNDILNDIKETGLDGIHALTPPPTGNTVWEHALDVLGEETIIIGILDPSIFISGPVEEIGPALDALYTSRLRRAHFCLWVGADGVPVPLERFLAVREWMEKNGVAGV